MRLGDWLLAATSRLSEAGIESSSLEAQVLAAHAFDVDRAWILAHPEAMVGPRLDALLNRRLTHEPLAYIQGWREFYGRRFIVRPGVLIPRQDTEILVEAALERMPHGARVLDIGVGSGAIALTLARERPDCTLVATDVSQVALETARENAGVLHANVCIVEGDLFPSSEPPFDVIVSNPPYVSETDEIGPDVRYEPALALFAGVDGLGVYRRLAEETPGRLVEGGHLLLEVGAGRAAQVRSMFESAGWSHEVTRRDLAGHERVVVFRCP
jgi:release factor glutamine methyltransferase